MHRGLAADRYDGVSTAPAPIAVLLVDDHAVVREGYRRLLERSGGIVVVGEAADGAQALDLCERLRPGIVVMDITLPGSSGIEVMRRMLGRDPATRVLIFSMHEDAVFARRALQAGARGYLPKSCAPAEMVEAVRTVANDGHYLPPAMAHKLALGALGAAQADAQQLTVREAEVLRLLAEGRSVREIAAALELTPKTVANHQTFIKQKLGAGTAIQLLRRAESLGLV